MHGAVQALLPVVVDISRSEVVGHLGLGLGLG